MRIFLCLLFGSLPDHGHCPSGGKRKDETQLKQLRIFCPIHAQRGIALQNANLAAESMGLGTVIIGGINRALPDLDEWLDLPEYVIPLAGLAVGVPNENPEQKPRLPQDAVFFENQYDHHLKEKVKRYDQETEEYYRNRTDNKKTTNWSQKMIDQLSQDLPLGFYSQYLKQKGFHFHSPGCRNHPASLFSK